MRILLGVLVLASVLSVAPRSASACDPAVSSVIEALRGADTVVRVTVRVAAPARGSRAAPRRITMTVESVLRGKPARATFEFNERDSTCDAQLVDGRQMIVPIWSGRPSSAYYDTYALDAGVPADVEQAVKAMMAAKTDDERRVSLVEAIRFGGSVAADAASVLRWNAALRGQLTEPEKQRLRAAAKAQGKRAPYALTELVKDLGKPRPPTPPAGGKRP